MRLPVPERICATTRLSRPARFAPIWRAGWQMLKNSSVISFVHAIAIAAVRTCTLRVLRADGELEALRMLCDRREELTRLRVQTVNRLQRLLAEPVPGKAKKDLTALQAKAILATVRRPRDIAGKTRRRIAAEELADLVAVEAKMKKSTAELKTMVKAR